MPNGEKLVICRPPQRPDPLKGARAVALILCAEMRDQIPLLEEDSDEDVARRRNRKEQVAGAVGKLVMEIEVLGLPQGQRLRMASRIV